MSTSLKEYIESWEPTGPVQCRAWRALTEERARTTRHTSACRLAKLVGVHHRRVRDAIRDMHASGAPIAVSSRGYRIARSVEDLDRGARLYLRLASETERHGWCVRRIVEAVSGGDTWGTA